MRTLALALLLAALAVACGKYGPPLRAKPAKKETPRVEVPLPAPGTAPTELAPLPEPEQEPPLEGEP